MSNTRITIEAQLQMRHDTETNWMAADPVLRVGEPAYTVGYDDRFKIGDGQRNWSELPYLTLYREDPEGAAPNALGDLSDVSLGQPSEGQALVYDEVQGRWVNRTLTGGGGGGLDAAQLKAYLEANGYATDKYVMAAAQQAYTDAVRASSAYTDDLQKDLKDNPESYLPLKTINGQSIHGEGNIQIEGERGEQGEQGEKGDKGDPGVTSAEVSVDNKTGVPSATASVEDQVLKINFSGLKGEQGNSGYTGAADELEVVNNLTQGGAAAALSAEMGKQLNEVLYGKTESNEGEDGGGIGSSGGMVDLSALPEQNCSLGTNVWYMQGSAGRHKAVPLADAKLVSVKVGGVKTYVAFVTSAYNPPVSNNASIPFATGYSQRTAVAANATYRAFVPSDAAWLILTTVDGAGNAIEYGEVELITDIDGYLTSSDFVQGGIDGSGNFVSNAKRIRTDKIAVKVGDKWEVMADASQKWAYELYDSAGKAAYNSGWITSDRVIEITADGFIGFAICKTSDTTIVPSELQTIIKSDSIKTDSGDDTEPSEPVVVDKGLVGKVDDLSSSVADIEDTLEDMGADIEDLQQQVAEGVEIVNNLTDGGIDKALSAEMGKRIGEVLYGGSKYIDLSTLPEQDCSLGSGAWYMEGSAGRHKAVDVKDAESVSIEVKGLQTYVAFVTSAYNPPVSNKASIPFATGYSQRTTIEANTTYEAEVPSDAAWLILTTVDGAGNAIEYGEVKVVMDSSTEGLIGVAHDVADIKETTESLYNDIHGVPVIVEQTQDDMTSDDYLSAQGRRGYIQWNVTEYPSWELSVNVPSSSTVKCAIQGSEIADYGTQVDDSGWINPGNSYTYSSIKAKPSVIYARLVFTDYASGSTIPSYDEIVAQGITFSFKTESRSGLITRMDELEGKISISPNSIIYQGEKVDLSDHGFTYKVIGSLSAGVSSRQGSALFGKYFFQFHNTLENIVVYDLEAKQNVQVISMTAIPNCHAGSGGFGNEYYDASDAFPLLYISSMDEMKVYVFRITGEVGAWSITLVQAITIDLDVLKIPNITIDRESNKIVFFGYTKNSWKEPSGNQSVITSCDIPLLSEGDVTISEFYNVSRLPFIYAQQGAFARFGKLYLSYGNTISDIGAFVIDYKGGVTLTSIDFTSMGNFEPEGFEKYGDKVIMTDQNGNIYELSF